MRNLVHVILIVLMTAVLALACDKPCEVIIPDKPEVPGQEVVDTLDTPQNPENPGNDSPETGTGHEEFSQNEENEFNWN